MFNVQLSSEASGCHPQAESHGCPFPGFTLSIDLSAMSLDDASGHRQTQSDAWDCFLGDSAAFEWFKDVRQFLSGYSEALIGDSKYGQFVLLIERHLDLPASGGIFDGIAHEIVEYLLNAKRVAADCHGAVGQPQFELVIGRGRLEQI